MGEQNVGRCNTFMGEVAVKADVNFTDGDVAALNEACFDGAGVSHMSDVPGVICWRDMGPVANRRYADLISGRCQDILKGEGAQEKCDALYEVVDRYAEEKKGVGYWVLEIGKYILGLFGVWLVFGPGLRHYNEWAYKRDAKKKDPPDKPTGTAGGGKEVHVSMLRDVSAKKPSPTDPVAMIGHSQVAPAAKPAPVDVVKIFQETFLGRYINFAEMAQELSSPHVATLDALRGELPSPTQMGYADMPDPKVITEYVFDASASEFMNPGGVPIFGVCSATGLPTGVAEPVPVRLPFGLRLVFAP